MRKAPTENASNNEGQWPIIDILFDDGGLIDVVDQGLILSPGNTKGCREM
jgi:hypothetical protein